MSAAHLNDKSLEGKQHCLESAGARFLATFSGIRTLFPQHPHRREDGGAPEGITMASLMLRLGETYLKRYFKPGHSTFYVNVTKEP